MSGRFVATLAATLAGALLALAALAGLLADPGEARAAATVSVRFRFTLQNLSNPSVPLREGAYLLHRDIHPLWRPGEFAREPLERIAEVGSGAWAIVQLGAVELTANTTGAGDLASWEADARPGDLLSFAQMPAPSNDAFIGVDSLALFVDGAPLRATLDLVV